MSDRLILTVDDSQTMRDLLRDALSKAGYRVAQADDGVTGVEMLGKIEPDLIITDLNMPRMDGVGFIEWVRGDSRFRATPILVLTTETDPSWKERARAAGATGWIAKPFDDEKLFRAIRLLAA